MILVKVGDLGGGAVEVEGWIFPTVRQICAPTNLWCADTHFSVSSKNAWRKIIRLIIH